MNSWRISSANENVRCGIISYSYHDPWLCVLSFQLNAFSCHLHLDGDFFSFAFRWHCYLLTKAENAARRLKTKD